jgi:uncharacterized membrane protein YcjF (UPF0283 family)
MTQRVVVSLIVGVVVGLVVASLVGIPRLTGPASIAALISNAFTFWGLVMGAFAGAVGMGLVFAVLNRRDRNTSRWGRRLAGATLALFAAGTISWIATWGFSPFSLEGLWIYPLAIMTTIGSVILLRPRRPGAWDEPPGA